MIARVVLLLTLPIIAGYALTRARRLTAVIGMGMFSVVIAAVYLLSHAPDVAITEAAIGAGLVTFIYILAIRKTGRLVIIGDEAPGLIQRDGEGITGLEWEILAGFARELGLEPTMRFVPRAEVAAALRRGDGDIGAGGIVDTNIDPELHVTTGHLPTALFTVTAADYSDRHHRTFDYFSEIVQAIRNNEPIATTIDLARYLAVARIGLSRYQVTRLPEPHAYVFVVAADQAEMYTRLQRYLHRLRQTGTLDELIRRYFP